MYCTEAVVQLFYKMRVDLQNTGIVYFGFSVVFPLGSKTENYSFKK